jgi:hypothetical protein
MELCLFSGPTWEEDTLNNINEMSVLLNARDMLTERLGYLKDFTRSQHLPNMLSVNQFEVYHD